MPYRKRQYGRKYKKGFKRSGGFSNMTVGQLAKKAYSGVRMLKGIVNSEKKSFDSALPNPQSSTATITGLSNIAQGDDYNAREGRSILVKSLEYEGTIRMNSSATDTLYRLVLFIDHDNTGTAPTAAQVGITGVNGMRSSNPVNMKRFTILRDRLIRVTSGANVTFPCNGFHKLSHHVKYDGTAATDAVQGSVWTLTVSDQATNTPAISVSTRLRYYDN